MNIRNFFLEMIQFLVFIPTAFVCYMPMKNQLKFSGIKIFLIITGTFCVFMPVATWCRVFLDANANTIIFISLSLFFICFHWTVKTDVSRSFAVFLFACELSAFPANFAYTFDVWLHPEGNYLNFSPEAGLFQLAIISAFVLVLIYPMRKYGTKLIDLLVIPRVWAAIASVTAVFLLLNVAIIPHNYSILYVGRCFPLYISILFVLLLMMAMSYTAFYHIAAGILKNAKLAERIQFFEMEEKQYALQQKYIEETGKQRHDFRQSLFTLKQLADSGDLASVKNYLAEYASALPDAEIVRYCKNNAVNALLNHYARTAYKNEILLKWNIDLPENFTVSEPDLCSLLGNLIENAVAGCVTVADNRYHYLSVTVRNEVNLYIVSTNSFDGVVKMKDNRYLSTKKNGGIGIHSAEMIAEKYHGTAYFHHKAGEFYADVMLKV